MRYESTKLGLCWNKYYVLFHTSHEARFSVFVHDFNVRARGEIIFVRLLRSETRKRIQSDPPNVYVRLLRRVSATITTN